jgi:KDO2-lipid IV(A) lauroyltransferase
LARLIPRRSGPALGATIGSAVYLLAAHRRAVALRNVALALGQEVDRRDQRRIVRAAYRQFGRIVIEGLMFSRYSVDDIAGPGPGADRTAGLIHYTGLEHIRAAYDSGRGVILFSAHFGNWELVALMQGYLGMPLTMITRPLDNPHFERLLAGNRSLSGNRIIHKKDSLRPMLTALKAGGGVAIVIDQNVRDGSAVFVDFFGRKAATTPSLALLALRTGAAIIPVFGVPGPGGAYRVEYLPEVVPEITGDHRADLLVLTQRCTRIIEDAIRRYPEAWLWMHERWKTRPVEEKRAARRAKEVADRMRETG